MRRHNGRIAVSFDTLPEARLLPAKLLAETALPIKSMTIARETLNKLLRGRSASLRGARMLAYLFDMSRILRPVRAALDPARGFLQRFPRSSL